MCVYRYLVLLLSAGLAVKTARRPSVLVTGALGAGKSTVRQLFTELEVPTLDLDEVAAEVRQQYQPQIVAHFGEHILREGELDRKKLREIIFEHKEEKLWLEALLHPPIWEYVELWTQDVQAPYACIFMPLVTPQPPPITYARLCTVKADLDRCRQRVCSRDQITPELFAAMTASQQAAFSDHLIDDVIDNNGSKVELQQQVLALHRRYLLAFTAC